MCRLAEGEIPHLGEHHVLGGLAHAADVHGRLGAVLGAIGTCQHDGAARVGDEADVEDVEGVDDRSRVEDVGHRDGLAAERLRVERRPLARGDGDLRPLLERGAVHVHVPCGDHAEERRGPAETERRLELPREARVAPRAHADARAPGLAVRDDRHVAEAVVEGGHRVADLDDERAAPHRGAIHVARNDAERLAEQRGRVLTGGEDAVHVGDLEPGVPDGVGDRLEVERELALSGEVADLVALVHADDADRTGERSPVSHGAHRTGSNSGSVISSVSFENTTCTGMSHLMALGSGSTLTRLVIRRGPSASSTIART